MGKKRVDAGGGRGQGVVNVSPGARSAGGKRPAGGPDRGGKRWFYIALGVLLVAGIGTLSYMAARPPSQSVWQMDSSIVLVPNQGHVIGSDTAPVEVVEFADFECPACGTFANLSEPDVRARLVNTGKIRFRFMDFPLDMHRNTRAAHHAAWCAGEQGKFWEMHDLIFQHQDRWSGEATNRPEPILAPLARQAGVNMAQYDSCMQTRKYAGQIQANFDEGVRRGAQSTPTFFIGRMKVATSLPYDRFKQYVDTALAQARTTAK